MSEFNAGDGIHYVHNKTFFILPDSFCTTPQLGMSQSYPVYASANRLSRNFSPQELDCIQVCRLHVGHAGRNRDNTQALVDTDAASRQQL